MNIPGGYILLARKILESDLMAKPPLWTKLWIWMLCKATKKPHGGLKPGQFKTSIQDMREAMVYKVGYRKITPSAKEIRGAYEGLAKGTAKGTANGAAISITKVTHGMVITILNFEKYQNPKNYEGHSAKGHEGHDEGQHEKSTKGHNNKQEEQEEESINTLSPEADAPGSEKDSKSSPIPEKFLNVSRLFYEFVGKHYPEKMKGKNNGFVAKGANTLRLLVERDGYDLDAEVRPALRWALEDDFWNAQINSLAELRKKSTGSENHKFFNLFQRYKKEAVAETPSHEPEI